VIGVDTNILVRYLAQDDPRQAALATRLFESLSSDSPAFISQIVLVETVWVLRSCYAADAAKIGQVIETLLRTETIQLERVEVVWRALRRFRKGRGSFPDALVTELARDAGCERIYSFDQAAAQRAGMTLLQ